MAVTIQEIASRTGLSRQTVSRIINDRNANLYAPETRQRVKRTCDELGYRPNAVSKAMRKGSFDALGLLAGTDPHRSYLPRELLIGINEEILRRHLHLVFSWLPDERLTAAGYVPRLLQELMVDSLMVAYCQGIPDAMLSLVRRHQVPSIWINADLPVDAVRPDDEGAGRLATEHLLRLGHRRIAYVDLLRDQDMVETGQGHYSLRARLQGYRLAMQAAGLAPRAIFSPRGHRRGEEPLPKIDVSWLSEPERPTAIVTYSIYGLHHMLMAGFRVPGDLSVITFGESPAMLDNMAIDLMLHPNQELGRTAVRLALEKQQDPEREFPTQTLPYALQAGSSTAAPPVA